MVCAPTTHTWISRGDSAHPRAPIRPDTRTPEHAYETLDPSEDHCQAWVNRIRYDTIFF